MSDAGISSPFTVLLVGIVRSAKVESVLDLRNLIKPGDFSLTDSSEKEKVG